MSTGPGSFSVIVVGAGGHGAEVHSYFQDLCLSNGEGELAGFLDDHLAPAPWLTSRILGGISSLPHLLRGRAPGSVLYLTAVGSNTLRRKLVSQIEALGVPGLRPWSLFHPTASVGYDVHVGDGTLLAPNTTVTTRVCLGRHCILNVRASVSHDCVVEDFVNLNPGSILCGSVRVAEGAFIGAGAVVKEKVTIGRNTIVGAGSVVIADLPPDVTAVGVPARIIKHHAAT